MLTIVEHNNAGSFNFLTFDHDTIFNVWHSLFISFYEYPALYVVI